jgi:phenylacetate-CoA ligase
VIENSVVPFYDFFRGTQRRKYGKALEQSQWLSREEILDNQNESLRALVKHAYDSVPYYRRVFMENGVSPDDIREQKDLTKLPVLTKRDILKHKEEMVSTAISKEKLIEYMSGGTGDQITFYVTKEQLSWELAAEYRAYGWGDYRLGDRCLLFWGSPIDIARHEALLKRTTSWIERIKVVNTYIISDEAMEKHVKTMREFNPEIIKGYASSVYMMAKHLKEKGIDDIRPRSIITSAEMLFPHYRSEIEDAFGCKVFDYYGSREIGALAAECEEHDGFHINAENLLLEFVRDNEVVSENESGLVLVTSLRNYGMPFIRYEIGDVGTPSSRLCDCGRGLPIIDSLEGRSSQFMAVRDKKSGKIVPVSTAAPGIIGNLLMYVPVNSYRVIQESLDRIVIKVVAGAEYSQKDTDFLVNHLHDYLGDSINIEVDKVDDLLPLPSGKRSVFVSKINAFHET